MLWAFKYLDTGKSGNSLQAVKESDKKQVGVRGYKGHFPRYVQALPPRVTKHVRCCLITRVLQLPWPDNRLLCLSRHGQERSWETASVRKREGTILDVLKRVAESEGAPERSCNTFHRTFVLPPVCNADLKRLVWVHLCTFSVQDEKWQLHRVFVFISRWTLLQLGVIWMLNGTVPNAIRRIA